MKRNVITTITFAHKKVGIVVLEKISTNIVELFNDFSNTREIKLFLSTAFQKIEKIIGGKPLEIGVIIEPSSKTNAKIKIYHEKLKIVGDTIVKQDIENIIQLIYKKCDSITKKTILVQPLEFNVLDIINKSYSKAPIHKKGTELSIKASVTTISLEVYNYIHKIIKSLRLNISQILLSTQTISQIHISKLALKKGSILIHIDKNHSFITINKHLATISTMSIYNFGYDKLLFGIAKIFKCSITTVKNIILCCSLDFENINSVIYTYKKGINQVKHYTYELIEIIKLFIDNLISICQKNFKQNNLNNLPIIFSGKLKNIYNIDKYLQNIMQNNLVSIYYPLSFIEMNYANINTLGFINFINIIDEILGKEFHTIIETNPNLISTFAIQKNKNKKWYNKLFIKLGEKYEWN